MSGTSLRIVRGAAPIAAALVVISLGATPSSAGQDPGTPVAHAGGCLLQRVGSQFVRCDNLTGNGIAAPAWIARADLTARRADVTTPDAGVASWLTPSKTVRHVTTSGSAAGGFAWSSDEHFETMVDCATFDAHVAASVTDRFTLSLDSHGAITEFTESVSAPRGVWTNTRTGASIVVAGHYVQVANRIPGTPEFNREVTGTRSVVEQPGNGAATKDVGRIVHDDLDASPWGDLSGQHYFADTMLTQPTPCEAIA